jgi:acyl-CoA synthetase (NDP forming)
VLPDEVPYVFPVVAAGVVVGTVAGAGTVETGAVGTVVVTRGVSATGAGLLLQAPEKKMLNIINIENKILFFIIAGLLSLSVSFHFIIKKEKSKDNHSMLSPITSSTGIEKTIPLASLLRP